ncbi:hypothetical protein BYT27DRAFT_7202192, partial [Phlegmacium glaucopus]
DSISKILSPIVSNLSAKFNFKEATYCIIVAAIIGHLSFFLHQELPRTRNCLERAAQIYQQSTRDASVKQEIEKIFELENLFTGSHVKHTFSNPFKGSLHTVDVNHELLIEEAVQTAFNNLLCMDSILLCCTNLEPLQGNKPSLYLLHCIPKPPHLPMHRTNKKKKEIYISCGQ